MAATAVVAVGQVYASPAKRGLADRSPGFQFSLNTATIRGQKLPVPTRSRSPRRRATVPLSLGSRRSAATRRAAEAGRLKNRISDLGLVVPARSALPIGSRRRCPSHGRSGAMEAGRRPSGLDRRLPHGRPAMGAYNVAFDLRRGRPLPEAARPGAARLGMSRSWKCGAGPKTLSRMSQVAMCWLRRPTRGLRPAGHLPHLQGRLCFRRCPGLQRRRAPRPARKRLSGRLDP